MFKYVSFKVIRSCYQSVDLVADKVVKYSLVHGNYTEKMNKIGDFETCAHVCEVLWKARKIELEDPREQNFMLRHEYYTNPNVIFSRNVTLLTVSSTHAIFVESPVDVHAHSTGPFFYINQFNHCKRVILVPLEHFITLTHDLDVLPFDPDKINYVLLSNTGRCGSTLLTQLFEDKTTNTVAISEPDFVMGMVSKHVAGDEVKRAKVLQACVYVLTASAIRRFGHKNAKDQQYNVIMKPKAHGVALTHELGATFPKMKHLFLYRHPLEYYKSLKTVYRALLHPLVDSLMMKLTIKMKQDHFILNQFSRLNQEDNAEMKLMLEALKNHSSKERAVLFIGLYVANILSIQHQAKAFGIDFKLVSFQELKDSPEQVFKDVVDFCNISINDDSDFSTLPASDSQHNSVLSRANLANYRTTVSEKEKEIMDSVLQDCHLPTLAEFSYTASELAEDLKLAIRTST